MTAGVEIKGRVGIALAIGVCVAAGYANRPSRIARRPARARSPLPVILSIEDDRASTRADLDVLLGALRGPLRRPRNPHARPARTSRRHHGSAAVSAPPDNTRATTATALGLALRGPALDGVLHGQQERAVLEALLAAGDSQLHATAPLAPFGLDLFSRTLGRLPYRGRRVVQVRRDVPAQDAREAVSAAPGCPARRRRERARVAGEAEAQDRDARGRDDRAIENRGAHHRSEARRSAAQRARGAHRRARASTPTPSRSCSRARTPRCGGLPCWRCPARGRP